jgi:hypothetical protein
MIIHRETGEICDGFTIARLQEDWPAWAQNREINRSHAAPWVIRHPNDILLYASTQALESEYVVLPKYEVYDTKTGQFCFNSNGVIIDNDGHILDRLEENLERFLRLWEPTHTPWSQIWDTRLPMPHWAKLLMQSNGYQTVTGQTVHIGESFLILRRDKLLVRESLEGYLALDWSADFQSKKTGEPVQVWTGKTERPAWMAGVDWDGKDVAIRNKNGIVKLLPKDVFFDHWSYCGVEKVATAVFEKPITVRQGEMLSVSYTVDDEGKITIKDVKVESELETLVRKYGEGQRGLIETLFKMEDLLTVSVSEAMERLNERRTV